MTNKDFEYLKYYLKMFFITSAFLLMILIGLSHAEEMDLSKAVIHHTASHDVSAKIIDQWHKERGWDGIGYHYVIRKDGTIEKGRSISKKGAHAKGRNHWIGIALTGYDKFTTLQINSLKKLLSDKNILYVERHHENCPSNGINVEELLK